MLQLCNPSGLPECKNRGFWISIFAPVGFATTVTMIEKFEGDEQVVVSPTPHHEKVQIHSHLLTNPTGTDVKLARLKLPLIQLPGFQNEKGIDAHALLELMH